MLSRKKILKMARCERHTTRALSNLCISSPTPVFSARKHFVSQPLFFSPKQGYIIDGTEKGNVGCSRKAPDHLRPSGAFVMTTPLWKLTAAAGI
jgi:hypothetical protein